MDRLEQGIALLKDRRLNEAEETLRACVADAPDDVAALTALGVVLAMRRKFDDAVPHLTSAITLDPKSANAWCVLGRVQYMRHAFNNAVTALQRTLEHGNNSLSNKVRLALAAMRARQYELCLEVAEEILEQVPNHPRALLLRAEAHFRQVSWEETRNALPQAEKAFPYRHPMIVGLKGFLALYADEYDEAETLIREALELSPNWLEAKIRLGDLFIRRGDLKQAANYLAPIARDNPMSGWAAYFHALASYDLTGKAEHLDAMHHAAETIEHTHEHQLLPGGLVSIHFRIGMFHYESKRFSDAANSLKRSVELAPRPRTLLHLGLCYFFLEHYQETISTLSRIRQESPEYSRARSYIGMSLMALGRDDEARDAFATLIEIDPMDSISHQMLGRIYLNEGRYLEAESYLASSYRIHPGTAGLAKAIEEFEAIVGRALDPDAGMSDVSNIKEVESFRLQIDEGELPPSPRLRDGLKVHARVSWAIICRDMLSSYGQYSLGYLWAILQPMMYIGTLSVIFHTIGRSTPYGISMEMFLLTGIVPVLCFFMNVNTAVTASLKSHLALMHFPGVTPIGIISARIALEFLTALAIMIISLLVLFVAGQDIVPQNALMALFALILMTLFGGMFGTFFGGIAQIFPSAEQYSKAFNRVIFFTSGAFFSATDLPQDIRDILLFNPMFHLIEMIRTAFFQNYESSYYSITYVLSFVAVLSLAGLTMDRIGRPYLVVR